MLPLDGLPLGHMNRITFAEFALGPFRPSLGCQAPNTEIVCVLSGGVRSILNSSLTSASRFGSK